MEEIIAPGGYKLINGKVRIQVVYDTESKTINNVKITGNDNYNGKIKYEVNNKTATIIIIK